MMAQLRGESSSSSNKVANREYTRGVGFHSKHKIFLSHSGGQKDFVEQLCVDLERLDRHPFFDKRQDSLPIGENFPQHIFEAIQQCQVGVVILSEEFFTRSKWPMIELVAMVREAKKRELGFKIVPVFLGMSIFEFHDFLKRDGWRSCWHELALMDNRIDVQEWVDALKHLEPLNSMVYDGLGEVKFRKAIVDVLCGAVPLQTRLEDSHIQGRSRLCKVIQESIDEKNEGVVVVGLYGMGGIGKTSICKALCNEYVGRFHGRVCHAELERKSKEELLREVLKRLTDTSHELLDRWNEDELLGKLNSGIIKEPIFLAVDNVSDSQVSIDEAKRYVLARLPSGSIVMVTSRSKETLKLVKADLVDKRVMEMPELDVEEARSLFCKSSEMEPRCKMDERVIKRCVERCYFRKGDGNGNYHYHPLTLDVLGKQLACINVEDWEAYMDKIDKDIFYGDGGEYHVIFSILRKSYDMLNSNDQLLFIDVALFLPSPELKKYGKPNYKLNTYEWLSVVHKASVDDVVCGLKRLRRKSLLENLGDGMGTGIGMHDLWRVFCEVEGQVGELRCRCWLYGAKGNMELIERCPTGGCWENLTRMAFLGVDTWNELGRVNFSHFSNVTILKISKLKMHKELVLDLSGLGRLTSLDIEGSDMSKLVLVGLPRCLVFLRVASSKASLGCSKQLLKQVGYLTKLEHLHLFNYSSDKLPNMRSMVFLLVATFYNCWNVVSLTGLGTKLSNLRVLHFSGCRKLESCPGVGNLVGLEDLSFEGCDNLKRLPNLGKLRNLRKLVVIDCQLITEVPGLDDLVALEELHATFLGLLTGHSYRLPDMSKLKNLRIMRLEYYRVEAVLGLDSLVSLEEVEVDFGELVEMPSLLQLTKLQTLHLRNGWHLQGLIELNNLVMLRDLKIKGCFGVDYLPDMQGLTSLQRLIIWDCGFKGVGGVSNLIALEGLTIFSCGMLERVPDLRRLTKLKGLSINGCRVLRRWDCTVESEEGSLCRSINNNVGSEVLDSPTLTALRTLDLSRCPFDNVMAIGALSSLEIMYYWQLDRVIELPDMSCFPRLQSLRLENCRRLQRLTIREPIHALTTLTIGGCSSLMSLPDLSNFPGLEFLELDGCEGIPGLSISEPLQSLRWLNVRSLLWNNPCGVKELPDLGMFPALEILGLKRCTELTSLRSSVPLLALRELDAKGCTSLSGADLDELQTLCPQCEIKRGAPDFSDVHNVMLERSRFQWIFGMFQELIELCSQL